MESFNVKCFRSLLHWSGLIILFLGCQKTVPKPDFDQDLSCENVEAFYQRLAAHTPRSFKYTGELEIREKETHASFLIFVYVGAEKNIRLDIHSEFNLLLSTIIFDREKISAYVLNKNEMHMGKLSAQNIFRLLGVRIEPKLVIDLLSMGFSSWMADLSECSETPHQLSAKKVMAQTPFTITIDKKSKTIESMVTRQEPSQSVRIALKTGQDKFPFYFPAVVEMIDERLSQQIKITVFQIETNKPISQGLFRPSFRSGVKIIQMDTH